MFKASDKKVRLGILGGGQLGRMLIQEAMNHTLSIFVMDPDEQAPCADFATEFVQGSLMDFNSVYQFGKKVDLLTIEIENVSVEALEQLEAEGLLVFPQPSVLRMIKDKGRQKLFYKEHHIPTAEFFLVENKAALNNYAAHFPCMQKLRTGGYDGRGVTKIAALKDVETAFDAPSILEKLIDFETEIAVIAARNASGEIAIYPAVEMKFNPSENLVEFLFSPAAIAPQVEKRAQEIAKLLVEKTGIVGLLAVEFFVTKEGDVLVNEMAPRPHNSGHQTIEGNYTSQYAQHLRAILNLPLGACTLIQPSVMINLLGEPGYEGHAVYEGREEIMKIAGVYLHLYGKKNTKPFRKMGHVTVLHPSMEKAKETAIFVKNNLKVIAV